MVVQVQEANTFFHRKMDNLKLMKSRVCSGELYVWTQAGRGA